MSRDGSGDRRWTWFAAAFMVLAPASALAGAGFESTDRVGTDAAALVRAPGREVRVEHFDVWLDAAPGLGQDGGEPARATAGDSQSPVQRVRVGRALWRRVADVSGTSLELELSFSSEDVRVLAVERDDLTGRFLVWRELRPTGGRSATLQGLAQGPAARWRRTSWGREGALRSECERRDNDVGFLQLAERARGLAAAGSGAALELRLFDPLADEWVAISLRPTAALLPGSAIRYEAVRASSGEAASEIAGWFEIDAAGLVAFGWQAGGLSLERVDPSDWAPQESIEASVAVDSRGR